MYMVWGLGSEQFLRYYAIRIGGRGPTPRGDPSQCHWMQLIIGNKIMYGLGVGI